MSKVFVVIFLIFGTVVGSGFSSGKEIMVFFSRFGVLSYLYILIAGFLFFWFFYFFLTTKISKRIEESKILNIIIFFISLVFCASMFAGIKNLFEFFPGWLYFLLVLILFVLCILVTKRGIIGLERANVMLMPAIAIVFLFVIIFSMSISTEITIHTNSWAGFLYSILYVGLNTSMSGIVISKVGETLTQKQAFWSSILSAGLLVLFLILGNIVLQQNLDTYSSDMPFLVIVKDNIFMFVLTYIIILAGCWTTLISLSVTLKSGFDKFIKNDTLSAILAVLVPFLLSILGFSQIVSMLYPLCSVLGLFILCFFVWDGKRKN